MGHYETHTPNEEQYYTNNTLIAEKLDELLFPVDDWDSLLPIRAAAFSLEDEIKVKIAEDYIDYDGSQPRQLTISTPFENNQHRIEEYYFSPLSSPSTQFALLSNIGWKVRDGTLPIPTLGSTALFNLWLNERKGGIRARFKGRKSKGIMENALSFSMNDEETFRILGMLAQCGAHNAVPTGFEVE